MGKRKDYKIIITENFQKDAKENLVFLSENLPNNRLVSYCTKSDLSSIIQIRDRLET